jgi:hypothetical protein
MNNYFVSVDGEVRYSNLSKNKAIEKGKKLALETPDKNVGVGKYHRKLGYMCLPLKFFTD